MHPPWAFLHVGATAVASFASEMVAALETARKRNPDLLSVRMPDGTTLAYASPEARDKALRTWQRILAREEGRRPALSRIKVQW